MSGKSGVRVRVWATHCEECGAPLPAGHTGVFCSLACNARSLRRRRRPAAGPPPPKHCARCGCALAPGAPNRRYCGAACRTAVQRARRQARRSGAVPPTRICASCGAAFSGRPRSAFCSRLCSDRARARAAPALPVTRPCEHCGTPFAKRAGTRFCSDRCQRQSASLRRPPPSARRSPRRRVAPGAPGRPPVRVRRQVIAAAQAQRAARDAYRTLTRRAGVASPEAAALHALRRLFVAAILAIPEEEAVLDEQEPIALSAPPIVRSDVQRAPRTRRGSAPLAEALQGLDSVDT